LVDENLVDPSIGYGCDYDDIVIYLGHWHKSHHPKKWWEAYTRGGRGTSRLSLCFVSNVSK